MDILYLIGRTSQSRADIASILEMSKPTVSALVEELIAENLVLERGQGQSSANGGRKPILLNLNSKAGLVMAVYLNESWYEVAVVDLSAETLLHIQKATRMREDYRQTLDDVLATLQSSIEQLREQGIYPPVLACGIAIKGLVDTEKGFVLYSAGFPGWRDVPVRDYVSEVLKLPVYIENDARSMAYAELLYGGGRGVRTLVCVSVSWGIGTGVVINDEIYRGANDVAVTFAHTTIAENGPLCSCGNHGCWEALASIGAFLRELADRRTDLQEIDLSEALKMFRDRDETVHDVLINYTGYWLGVGIANMLNAFNPEKLILQGAISQAGKPVLNKIQEVVSQRALPIPRTAQISFSELTHSIEVKGAAAVVIKRFFSEEDHNKIWRPGEFAGHAF